MKLLLLTALKAVIIITFNAASAQNFVKMTFSFQWGPAYEKRQWGTGSFRGDSLLDKHL